MSITRPNPTHPVVETENGISFTDVFEIDASSELNALSLLHSAGVTIGARLTDVYGNSPDARIKCQQIEITAKVPARTSGGGSATGLYEARAIYSTPNGATAVAARRQPTPNREAVWSIESSLEDVPVDHDIDGEPLQNTVAEPFDPPLTALRPNEIWTAKWIVSGTNFFVAAQRSRQFRGRINSVTWKGADPHEVLCHTLLPVQIDENEVQFTARFQFRDSYTAADGSTIAGWDRAIINRGFRHVNGTVIDGITNYDRNMDQSDPPSPLSTPKYLDANGNLLADGSDPHILTFQLLPEIDFNDLGI